MQYFERLTKPNVYVWTGLFKQHAVSCDMEFYPENCSRIPATNLTEKDSDCHEHSCVTEAVTTTELTPVNDGLKKNWHDSWRTCCKESKVLYEKGMDVDSGNFNLTREMVGQKVDEIYLNDKLVPGDFIIPMGTFSTTYTFHSLSENGNLYDCALACKSCWYFGMRNNSCLNVTSLAHFNVATRDDPMNVRLFSVKGSSLVANTALPSSDVECVQIELNTAIFPVTYSLTAGDCRLPLPPLCERGNDSTYLTSQKRSSFEIANEFCDHEGASLASFFDSKLLYFSKIPQGRYWTSITRKIHPLKTDCNAEPYDGYCRKMLITGEIILINCTIKTNFICVKERIITTSTTTTITATTTY
uniref:Uncharacterized protein LOC111124995 isoform X1 n=1 Tax=Crassostrea virginica TaxID=6565 RepID=A0A8B8D957_CRAVI|nr:uncharacterized protein LOC111124995 isoform X1 [Crassostrea virginica]XP_022324080.1 uncharacterized protein LOC111124995 isoform X1 [Crassostrea virginica]